MNEPELDIPEEFYAYKSRAASYIARLSGFPFQWALPVSPKTETGFPTRFFRWDQRRFKRLIEHAEHLIRCLIIWMAYARLRSGLVKSGSFSLLGCNPSPSGLGHPAPVQSLVSHPEPPSHIHPHFVLRGLPLYDQKLPAFRVSLPSPPGRGAGGEGLNSFLSPHPKSLSPEERDFFGHSPERALCEQKANESKTKLRPRNDTIHNCDRLIARMERLGTLIEEIDTRADRIAGIWLARMSSRAQCGTQLRPANTGPDARTAPVSGPGSARHHSMLHRIRDDASWHPIPIKSPDPPPDILQDASDDERDDLLALHDAAIRAAELFSQHCG